MCKFRVSLGRFVVVFSFGRSINRNVCFALNAFNSKIYTKMHDGQKKKNVFIKL